MRLNYAHACGTIWSRTPNLEIANSGQLNNFANPGQLNIFANPGQLNIFANPGQLNMRFYACDDNHNINLFNNEEQQQQHNNNNKQQQLNNLICNGHKTCNYKTT